MLETSARLLRLLALLQSRPGWTGPELADRLDVGVRTIRNDVDRLRRLGYPIEGQRGAAGRYRLGSGATLPPLLLDDDEAVAVAIGLGTAVQDGIEGVEDASLRALTKLETVLPARLRRRVDALRTFALRVPPDSPGPRVNSELLSLLANACRDRERVRLRYTAHNGEVSHRSVEPHRVVAWGQRWYLVAWDEERRDWRTFRIDRIASLAHTGRLFAERDLPERSLTAYIARNVSRAGWRYQARFRVAASAEDVLERINPAVGIVEPIDDRTCLLEAGADSLDTIAVYIGLLGFDFTVEHPAELVPYLRELAERYHRAATPSN